MTTMVDAPEASSAANPAPLRARRRVGLRWLLVVIPVVVVAVFFAYPVLQMFLLSFTDFAKKGQSGLDNYIWYLGDSTQRTILIRTFVVSALVTALCLILGFPYAYLMTLVGSRARLLMVGIIMVPFWTSLLVRLYAWVILLQSSGPIQSALQAFGLDDVKILGTIWGLLIGSVQVLLPFMVLPLYATLTTIDRRLLDAAESLGAKPSVAFRKVYLPLAVPGMLAGSTIVFIFMLGFYYTPILLGGSQTSLVSQQIVTQIGRLLAFGRGGAMAVILLILTAIVLGAAALATRRISRAVTGGSRDD